MLSIWHYSYEVSCVEFSFSGSKIHCRLSLEMIRAREQRTDRRGHNTATVLAVTTVRFSTVGEKMAAKRVVCLVWACRLVNRSLSRRLWRHAESSAELPKAHLANSICMSAVMSAVT